MNLENQGVLLSGIGRAKDLLFQKSDFLGGEWGYSLFFPLFTFLIIW
jgi:hypothetical protein